MNPDILRERRNSYTTVYTKFTRLYKQDNTALFCFFEGQDSQYYGIRIKTIINPHRHFYLDCKGKKGVKEVRKIILSKQIYNNTRIAYFIDKDFDNSIYDTDPSSLDDVYETPCYSIENFYTSKKAFQEILKTEFKIDETDDNFQRAESLYLSRQQEFHQEVELLNAWIAYHKDFGYTLKLSKYEVSDFVSISLDKIENKYDLHKLAILFPDCPTVCHTDLKDKIDKFSCEDKQKYFRGKFEADFLYKILMKLIEQANIKTSAYFSKKLNVSLQLSRKTMISDLSQCADVPQCLVNFLKKFAN